MNTVPNTRPAKKRRKTRRDTELRDLCHGESTQTAKAAGTEVGSAGLRTHTFAALGRVTVCQAVTIGKDLR